MISKILFNFFKSFLLVVNVPLKIKNSYYSHILFVLHEENFIGLLSSSPETAQHTRVGLAMQEASMTASAEGWPKTKALCSERRRWRRPQHCTKSRARRPSWRVLFDAWRRWPPRTFFSRFFWFLSSVFLCSVFSPYLYLLKTCSVFSPCVCHNWSRLQWMFLDGLYW